MGNKELIPPGLTYLADNIISKDNLLGAAKEDGAKWTKDLYQEGKARYRID